MKAIVFIAASLDGFIARKDGDVSWLESFEPMDEGEDGGYGEMFAFVDALVMGRGTFEKVISFDIPWPYGDKPVIVMSKTLTKLPAKAGEHVRITSCTPRELIAQLEDEGMQKIYIDGGKVIQFFLREGLIDEITVTQMPVLLGSGIPLFGAIGKEIRLELLAIKSWPNGFVQFRYGVKK